MSFIVIDSEGPVPWDTCDAILRYSTTRRQLLTRPGVAGNGILYDRHDLYSPQTVTVTAEYDSQALAQALVELVRGQRQTTVTVRDQFDRDWTMEVLDVDARYAEQIGGKYLVTADYTFLEIPA